MLWFKKKMSIEDFVEGIIRDKLPRAVAFFNKENERSHLALAVNDRKLREIGAGMVLFFMGKYYPDTDKKNLELMSRAYRQIEKTLPAMDANPKETFAWWKAYTDGLIFQENEARLRIACRITWEKLESKPFRETSPLRTFGYFLEMEVQALDKMALA